MPLEIERKYLVVTDQIRFPENGQEFCQGYIQTGELTTVRVRRVDGRGLLTIKGQSYGSVRKEFEYEIPDDHAIEMLESLCEKPFVEKVRYKIDHLGHTWEVDVFKGVNQGLITAEVELASEDETFHLPPWLGDEVTHDFRYANSNLVRNPFSKL